MVYPHSVYFEGESFEHLNRVDDEGIQRANALAHPINEILLLLRKPDHQFAIIPQFLEDGSIQSG
jgi:hypothetical protein